MSRSQEKSHYWTGGISLQRIFCKRFFSGNVEVSNHTCSFFSLYTIWVMNYFLSLSFFFCAIFSSASSLGGLSIGGCLVDKFACCLFFFFFALQRESPFPLQTTVGPCHKDSHWRMKDLASRNPLRTLRSHVSNQKRNKRLLLARDFFPLQH